MEPSELDKEIEELEIRVERLRALYEQYFLGIEKIEPLVPRKDVDRRIWRLRREQIRNTGKRFRLQTIIQRYNTFQQYWMRICREIEAGTYTRHLNRAKKLLEGSEALTIAAKKRHRATLRALDRAAEEEARRRELAEAAASDLEDLARSLDSPNALDESMREVESLLRRLAPPAQTPSTSTPQQARHPAATSVPPTHRSMPAPGGSILPPLPVPPPIPPGGLRGPRPPPSSTGPLSGRPPLRAPGPAGPLPGQPPPSARGPWPAPGPAGPPSTRGVPPHPGSMARSLRPPPKPKAPVSGPSAPPPSSVAGPPVRVIRQPTIARPQSLSEARLQDIHQRLVAAKQQTNDQALVSVDGLRRSLESTARRLREKHGQHRSVDFEVVIKDGRAVIKPTVR